MAISSNRGAKVLIDARDTLEMADIPNGYSYITSNGSVSIDSGKMKLYSVFWGVDGGTITIYADNGFGNVILLSSMSRQTSFQFGPKGITIPGLSVGVSGGTAPRITLVHSTVS